MYTYFITFEIMIYVECLNNCISNYYIFNRIVWTYNTRDKSQIKPKYFPLSVYYTGIFVLLAHLVNLKEYLKNHSTNTEVKTTALLFYYKMQIDC